MRRSRSVQFIRLAAVPLASTLVAISNAGGQPNPRPVDAAERTAVIDRIATELEKG